MSNTVTVSIPRYAPNTHTEITSITVDPDSDHLSLFRGDKLHAIYRRGAWDHFITESDDEVLRRKMAETLLPRTDERKALDAELSSDRQAILTLAERVKLDLHAIVTLARTP